MYQKTYENTPKGKYRRQRSSAERRNIPWDISFEDWWQLWETSGMWEQRGVGRDKYCMSRIDDQGAYALGNVEIKSQWDNRQEYLSRRWNKLDPFRRYDRESVPAADAAWTYKT